MRDNLPTIDLHGEDKITAIIKTKEFINDSYKLGYTEVGIIHGVGKGILRTAVHEELKKSEKVLEYEIDFLNSGVTYLKIKRIP